MAEVHPLTVGAGPSQSSVQRAEELKALLLDKGSFTSVELVVDQSGNLPSLACNTMVYARKEAESAATTKE